MKTRSFVLSVVAASMSTLTGAAAAQHQGAGAAVVSRASMAGVVGSLDRISTIGSTVDRNGDQNPYGLAIAPASGGKVVAGDLVVCNFNNFLNIQGLGSTIELLKPRSGATPERLSADSRLTGCAALAMGGAAPWVAALDANDNPIVLGSGAIFTALKDFPWQGPWGQAFAAPGPKSPPAFYESNANDGSIVRINLGTKFTYDEIVTGLPVNHGVPGSILAPSGLTYDAQRDVLYVVDGAMNAVVAIHAPSSIAAGGVAVQGRTIGGPSASHVRLLYTGAPLSAPISAALLFDGDLVVGNTGDNRLIELTPEGRVAGSRVLDAGVPGALFGIAASGNSATTTRIYFNDDNDNTVKVLQHS